MSGYYQRKIINFFCCWSHSGVKMESIGNTNVFVTIMIWVTKTIIVLVTHITISNQLPRADSRFLCFVEWNFLISLFISSLVTLTKCKTAILKFDTPYCIHLVWLWQDNSQSLTNHSVRISIIMWVIILSWIKLRKRSCNLSA